jgi:D-serine deaminase-like pyridoxal phosphate-dependent protein
MPRRIRCGGITCERITGAGTGTFALEAASGVWNELQVGSYLFMDADYGRNRLRRRRSSFSTACSCCRR